jgi:osmotically-inducible protein OsmY
MGISTRTRLASLLLILVLIVPLFAQGAHEDDRIYDAVRTKLANDVDVKGGGIDVTVKDGVVTLRGHVHDQKARGKAEKITKKIKGVVSVSNELTLFGQD